MIIFGIGTDIVNIKRMDLSLKKRGSTFKNRVFSKKEITYCENKKNSSAFYAKRFAAKEAFSKSLGTGIRKGVNLKNIEVADCINQLEDCCNKNKVEIIKSTEVKKIVTQNNSVTGVQLKNGEILESNCVISNADPKTTYLNLLGAEILDTDFIRRAKNFRNLG